MEKCQPLVRFFFLLLCSILGAQSTGVNLNDFYAFPFSIGIEYESISPFADYGGWTNVYAIEGNLRYPLPFLKSLQPSLSAGVVQFDSRDPADPLSYDSTHIIASLGAVYAQRIAKTFEIGADLFGGISQSYFPNLSPDAGTTGALNAWGQAGLRVCLNASYNFVLDFHPNVKYLYSFSPLAAFNGFMLGVGFSAQYRFGEDPDAPRAIIRSLELSDANFAPAFAAMQSFYSKNPLGTVRIKNIERHAVKDLSVSFFQAGYMDGPTLSATIPELKAGEAIEVPILATFNENVFKTEGITPLTGEIITSYASNGRPAEQKTSVSFELHDKTAIAWDDDRKLAAFITSQDSAVRNYASFIRQACKDDTIPTLGKELQFAIQAYQALGVLGILYQSDPGQPFSAVSQNALAVDSVSLPRDTLKRASGDCDDLTALYCTLLETVGIETGFITIPGHIFSCFNTKMDGQSFAKLHPDREMSVNYRGELWVPVEITMIGKSGFMEAWMKGMEEYRSMDAAPEKRGFFPSKEAQAVYRPVVLRESDLGLQYGNKDAIDKAFKDNLNALVKLVLGAQIAQANASQKREDHNRLGILYAQYAMYPEAQKSFELALKIDPAYVSAKINLGNVLYLKKEYARAIEAFSAVKNAPALALALSPLSRSNLCINIAKAQYELGEFEKASAAFAEAEAFDAGKAAAFAYLAQKGGQAERAASAEGNSTQALFIEE